MTTSEYIYNYRAEFLGPPNRPEPQKRILTIYTKGTVRSGTAVYVTQTPGDPPHVEIFSGPFRRYDLKFKTEQNAQKYARRYAEHYGLEKILDRTN